MRIGSALAVAVLFASGLSGCGNPPAALTDADRTDIRAAVDSFTNAVGRNDYALAAMWYTENGVIMPPNAPPVEGRAAVQKALEGFGRVTAISQPIVEIDGVGDLAYARVNYEVTFYPPNTKNPITDMGKVLIIMRKQPDGWRTIRGMHSSNLPASGPMPKA